MFHKILVALDYSDRSRQALDQAIELAHLAQADLMLLHVLSAADHDYPIGARYPFTDIGYADARLYQEIMERHNQQWQHFEQEHSEILQSFAREAERQGVSVKWAQLHGNAGQAICQMAQDSQADLILLGRRGRSGWQEALLGSVSNYVMHHAPCTVMVVQDKARQVQQSVVGGTGQC